MKDITTGTAPPMIWLQVDCNADADDRGERFPDPPEGVSWNPESVQGLEVEYVRADLVRAAMPVNATDDGDPELQRLAEVLGMTANTEAKPSREAASR